MNKLFKYNSPNIKQVLRQANEFLRQKNIPHPERDTEILLQHILKSEKHPLLYSPSLKLNYRQLKNFQTCLQRRANHEPVAYITKRVIFFDIPLFVNKSVLIPRSETEELTSQIIQSIKKIPHQKKGLKIADIGTGCGAIAIALALNFPDLKIYATDISTAAISVAKRNIVKHNLQNIILKKGDLLKSFPSHTFDIIIANLPYIPSHWLDTLSPDIIDFEPKLALDGGPDGLSVIKKLLLEAKTKLNPQGKIFLEIWHKHRQSLKNFLKKNLPSATIALRKDISGLDRFAIIQF